MIPPSFDYHAPKGAKDALIIWVGTWFVAFLVGGLLSQVLI
jgi:hypothetical protein